MHTAGVKKTGTWLLPVILILFILQVILLPWVVGFTWADNHTPHRILTYTENKLQWDSDAQLRPDGTIELGLFDPAYDDTVLSSDGATVIAPGTQKTRSVRLLNQVSGDIQYTAVLYQRTTDRALPILPTLTGDGLTDTDSYNLPESAQDARVLRAVTGTVKGKQLQDLDVSWQWVFETDTAQDISDTNFGDKIPLDQVEVGLFITVQDNNSYVEPQPPKTGDNTAFYTYLAVMVLSAALLVILLIERKLAKKRAKA